MAKKKGSFFLQLKRDIFTEKYANLSTNAKWLYVVLNELEHKFTGEKEDFFFRMNDDLAKDCNMALGTFKKAKKELLETDLVQHWHMHFNDPKTGKKSERKISTYRIL